MGIFLMSRSDALSWQYSIQFLQTSMKFGVAGIANAKGNMQTRVARAILMQTRLIANSEENGNGSHHFHDKVYLDIDCSNSLRQLRELELQFVTTRSDVLSHNLFIWTLIGMPGNERPRSFQRYRSHIFVHLAMACSPFVGQLLIKNDPLSPNEDKQSFDYTGLQNLRYNIGDERFRP